MNVKLLLFVANCMLAAPLVAQFVLLSIGFSGGGVVANSIAASWQSSIGNVGAKTLFAALQSAGAAGLPATAQAVVSAAAGLRSKYILVSKWLHQAMNDRNALLYHVYLKYNIVTCTSADVYVTSSLV
jgi:Interferon-induced 6-16 family